MSILQKHKIENKNDKDLYKFKKFKQMFKYKTLERNQRRNIDWFFYRKYILRSHLYFYYQAVVKVNFHRQIFFVENNVDFHQKAQRIIAEERDEFDIKITLHCFNSSDIHFIKTIFNYMKNSLKKYNLKKYKVDQIAKERAKVIILKKWKKYQEAAVTVICKDFKNKL